MGLFNDVRFYLMAALAILFLLVVAMCTSAYDSSPDGHAADTGVKHESSAAAESEGHADKTEGTEGQADEKSGEQTKTQALVSTTESTTTETAAVVETAVVETAEVEEVAVEEVAVEEEVVAEEVAVEPAAPETTEETTTAETAVVAQPTVAVEQPTTEGGSLFEISPLSETGNVLSDFGTDLGNLKTDMGKFTDRLQNAQ